MNPIKIKFGTDGWRAIIAKEYTTENVARVTLATAKYLLSKKSNPSVVVGHDCRFGGPMFAEITAQVFIENGIKVFFHKGIVSTPMISLATVNYKADFGIIITASHNPAEYNGYKIKANYGGPATPAVIEEIETMIPETSGISFKNISSFENNSLLEYVDIEELYIKHVEANFDIEKIKNSNINIAYDAMYGAGQNVMWRLFPDATFLHCELNPGFDGQAPEPIDKNLQELSETIKISEDIDFGLATDGDADRIGLYDEKGNFVDSHHIILLLVHYLKKYKNMEGSVVKSFSCSNKIDELCKKYGIETKTTKIGFKYICEHIINEDVMIGGEESGGIAIKGHIPERDGIWIGLTLLQYMAETGKSLTALIQEIYTEIGTFAMDRIDEHVEESMKQSILEKCKNGEIKDFGDIKIIHSEDIDGYKYHIETGGWVMLRASGTEPVLRIYCESENLQKAKETLQKVKKHLLG